MKILIFLQGTVIIHKSGVGKTREERVRDSIEQAETVRDFASYVPIGNAPKKLQEKTTSY